MSQLDRRVRSTTPLRRFVDALPRKARRQKLLSLLCKLRVVGPIQYTELNGNAGAWVDLRDAESRATFLSQCFWPEVHPMAAAFLRGGGAMFDVGANLGLVTFGTVPLAGGHTQYHLFEANPALIPILRLSAAEWPGTAFHVNHCCVSDVPGESRLLVVDGAWGHARIASSGESVPNLLLDDYVHEHAIERISFLKMDIEGWELRALQGGRRSLTSGRISAGFIEVFPEALRRAGASAGELIATLEEYGFDMYFAGLWQGDRGHGPEWKQASIHGESLRFARALPLPDEFTQGDLLVIHRTHPLASAVRSAVAT